MILIDTNVLSELRKVRAGKAHPAVQAWAEGQPPAASFVSVISVMEIQMGIEAVRQRDPAQTAVLTSFLEQDVITAFEGRILPVDVAVAQRAAMLHFPQTRSHSDALIGATALVHGFTVVTRNTRDFEPMGVPLLNPWEWVQ